MSQTRRNATTEFWIWILQTEKNYVRIQCFMKIWTPLRSFYSERILFSHVFAHSHFASLSDIDILLDSVNNFNQIDNCRYFQVVEEKFFLPVEVDGGLATGWFVIVANFAPHFFGGNSCGKIPDRKFSNAEIWYHVRANWENF